MFSKPIFMFFLITSLLSLILSFFIDEEFLILPHVIYMTILGIYYILKAKKYNVLFLIAFMFLFFGNFAHYLFKEATFLFEMGFLFIANFMLLVLAILDNKYIGIKKSKLPFLPITLLIISFFIFEMLKISKAGLGKLYIYGVIYSIFLGGFVVISIYNFIENKNRRYFWLMLTAIGCMMSDLLLSSYLFTQELKIFLAGNILFQMVSEYALVNYGLSVYETRKDFTKEI